MKEILDLVSDLAAIIAAVARTPHDIEAARAIVNPELRSSVAQAAARARAELKYGRG